MWSKQKKGNGDASLPDYEEAMASSSTDFKTSYASVSLHEHDRLRFLKFPPSIIDACRETIQAVWKRGIQAEREFGGSTEIKLRGDPWLATGDDAVGARRLICALLNRLHTMGWVLALSTDISKKSDKDTLMFRHQVPAPSECDWGCIAFSKTNRIRFIDVPNGVFNGLISRLDKVLIQDHYQQSEGVYELKIQGSPWYSDGTETMAARGLLLTLLEVLEGEGYTVYASIDQKYASDGTETDTWHCCRAKGWTKGTPVYYG